MTNNKSGGQKAKQTLIKKYGSYEAYLEKMRENARKGGKNGTSNGFAHGKVNPVEAGKKGAEKRYGRV